MFYHGLCALKCRRRIRARRFRARIGVAWGLLKDSWHETRRSGAPLRDLRWNAIGRCDRSVRDVFRQPPEVKMFAFFWATQTCRGQSVGTMRHDRLSFRSDMMMRQIVSSRLHGPGGMCDVQCVMCDVRLGGFTLDIE